MDNKCNAKPVPITGLFAGSYVKSSRHPYSTLRLRQHHSGKQTSKYKTLTDRQFAYPPPNSRVNSVIVFSPGCPGSLADGAAPVSRHGKPARVSASRLLPACVERKFAAMKDERQSWKHIGPANHGLNLSADQILLIPCLSGAWSTTILPSVRWEERGRLRHSRRQLLIGLVV